MQPVQIFNEDFIAGRRKERLVTRARKKKAKVKDGETRHAQSPGSVVAEQSTSAVEKFASGLVWVPARKLSVLDRFTTIFRTSKPAGKNRRTAAQISFADMPVAYAALIGVVAGTGLLGIGLVLYAMVTGSLSKWMELL
jgi:hypothetical protein